MTKRKARPQVVGCRFWEGVTNEHEVTKSELRYFGILKRVPVGAFPRHSARMATIVTEWDETLEAMRQELPDTLPTSLQGWEPVPKGAVERYEAIDRETGELLIFWRVPCRRKG